MADPVRRWATERPAAVAAWDGARDVTYAELDGLVDSAAARLARAGATGQRVALLATPTLDTVVCLHAILRAGGTIAPLHPKWTVPELAEAIATLSPVLVVTEAGLAVKALAAAGTARPTVQSGMGEPVAGTRFLAALPGGTIPAPRPSVDPCAVLWTSGSSGRPRGVVLSWAGFEASAGAVAERLDLRTTDTWLASLALAHVGGLALVLRAAILGCSVALIGPFDVAALARLIDAGRVTHASLVPTMLSDLLRVRRAEPAPPSLRALLLGGAATPPALLTAALALEYPIALTYGLTEATSQVATAPPALVVAKPGTVGEPLRGVGVRLNDGGGIEVSGPTTLIGYVGGESGPAPGEWFRTGDVGRLDADGHLRIEGRLDERIVSAGVTIFPTEIERVIEGHPDVAEALVVGVRDPHWGETVAAVVIPKPGRSPSVEGLDRFGREHLAPAKIPRRYLIRDVLPRTPTGKVDRAAVVEEFEPS